MSVPIGFCTISQIYSPWLRLSCKGCADAGMLCLSMAFRGAPLTCHLFGGSQSEVTGISPLCCMSKTHCPSRGKQTSYAWPCSGISSCTHMRHGNIRKSGSFPESLCQETAASVKQFAGQRAEGLQTQRCWNSLTPASISLCFTASSQRHTNRFQHSAILADMSDTDLVKWRRDGNTPSKRVHTLA